MFHDDHEPPNIHAIYGEYRAIVGLDPVKLSRGDLPRRAQSLVAEWRAIHQRALLENWSRARQHAALRRIAPLD